MGAPLAEMELGRRLREVAMIVDEGLVSPLPPHAPLLARPWTAVRTSAARDDDILCDFKDRLTDVEAQKRSRLVSHE